MPIDMPAMPPHVATALATGLARFAVAASPPSPGAGSPFVVRPSIARGAKAMSQSIEAALAPGGPGGAGAPVRVLGLSDLAAGTPLRQAPASLWLQLLPANPDGTRAMAEVDQGLAKLTAVSEGPEVKKLAERIGDVTAAPPRTLARQELTLIRVPALHLTAIWLKGDDGNDADDVVIPSDGPIEPLVLGRHYPLAEFQRIAGAMAAERLAKTKNDMGG